MNKKNLLLLLSVCAFSVSTVITPKEIKLRWKKSHKSKKRSPKKLLKRLKELNPGPNYTIHKLNVHFNGESKMKFRNITVKNAIAEIEAGINRENFRTQK